MAKIKARWSDGTRFVLENGQVWEDKINGEHDVIVVDANDKRTIWRLDHPSSKPMPQTTHGVDGFCDFLESNCYTLKKGGPCPIRHTRSG